MIYSFYDIRTPIRYPISVGRYFPFPIVAHGNSPCIRILSDGFSFKYVPHSGVAMNKGNMKDSEMETIMDTTVDGLFSVFATLGVVPVIRSPRGNAAEMVAEKLDKKLRENLRDTRNTLFTAESNYRYAPTV